MLAWEWNIIPHQSQTFIGSGVWGTAAWGGGLLLESFARTVFLGDF
jgi:hypothetical protein